MKNLSAIKSQGFKAFIFLFLFFTQFSYAQTEVTVEEINTNTPVSIFVANNGNVRIAIDNPEAQKFKISIVDTDQKVWFEENTFKKVYRKTFDFNQNFQDVYEVVVSSPEKTYRFKLKRADVVKYSLVPLS